MTRKKSFVIGLLILIVGGISMIFTTCSEPFGESAPAEDEVRIIFVLGYVGGLNSTVDIPKGTAAGDKWPADPERSGYTFGGWFSGDDKIDSDSVITGDIRLTAKWTAIPLEKDFYNWAYEPPMGWNSYDCFGANVIEAQVRANAKYMADNLRSYGYEYVVVDIRWFVENQATGPYNTTDPIYVLDEWGRYMPAVNRFRTAENGAGFRPLANYVHSLGLKFGIHIMRGIPVKAVQDKLPIKDAPGISADQIYTTANQCNWLRDNYTIDSTKPGAQEYYDSIFELYAEWDVDYVKVDDISRPYREAEIEMIRRAIEKTGRPIVLSLSPGSTPINNAAHVKQYANMWRMTDDVWDRWGDIVHLLDTVKPWFPGHVGFDYWPDADMMPFGKISITGHAGGAADRYPRINQDEQTSNIH
jgi:uncharacterized repeat protein (TIGR02543 family)